MRRFVPVVVACLAVTGLAVAGFSFAAVTATDAHGTTTNVTVHIHEWSFDLSQDTVPAGTVVFTVFNDGPSEPHDFSIGGRTSDLLLPGQSTILTAMFTEPGLYTYVDTRADTDREMYGVLTVTGTVASTAATTTRATTTAPTTTASVPSKLPLQRVADVSLPGGASRFDYQSVDQGRRRLFIAHLGGGDVVVFDLAGRRVVKDIAGVSDVHGVLVVPSLQRLYAAATGSRELVTFDERTLRPVTHAPAGSYPDGIAYDPRDGLVFVSDEQGDQVTVFQARSGQRNGAIALAADAGNVQYDSASRHILVDVGAKNELAVINPRLRRIIREVALPGCDHAHGLHLDSPRWLAFVACDRNAKLLVVDLRTMRVVQTLSVGADPDVLAFDVGLRRLYVASESGEVAVFVEQGRTLRKLGQAKLADSAHSVAVDPLTHLVYFPLENVNGKPVLRIMRPTGTGA